MLRRAGIVAPLVALTVAVAGASPAHAVPVPMDTCAPGVVAPGALPCLREGDDGELAAMARSGASVLWRVWSTTALVLF